MAVIKPFQPVIRSVLNDVINALPDDWVMKEQSVKSALKKAANPLTGKGLKDEELEFADIIDPTSTKTLTKKDLQGRIANRKDQFTQTILGPGEVIAEQTTLKELRGPRYEEKVRMFNVRGERVSSSTGAVNDVSPSLRGDRNIPSHYTGTGIYDEHYATRRNIQPLTDADGNTATGRIIFEIQADNIQTRRRVGGTLKQNRALKTQVDLQDSALKGEEIEIRNKIANLQTDTFAKAMAPEDIIAGVRIQKEKLEELGGKVNTVVNTKNAIEFSYGLARQKFQNIMAPNKGFKPDPRDVTGRTRPVVRNIDKAMLNQWLETAPQKLEILGAPPSEVERLAREVNDFQARMRTTEIARTKQNATQHINFDAQDLEFYLDEFDDLIKNTFEIKEVQYNLKGQFGFVPPKDPFDTNFVEKAIDDELIDAYTEGLEFIAVPLETGTDDLIRGGYRSPKERAARRKEGKEEVTGVQKWYETTVRNTLKKKEKTLNNSILQNNPNATKDELFHYTEEKVPVSNFDTYSTTGNDGGFSINYNSREEYQQDIKDFVDISSTQELEDIAVQLDGLDTAELYTKAQELVARGDSRYTNVPHTYSELLEEEVTGYMWDIDDAVEINGILNTVFDIGPLRSNQKSSHTLGRIMLPRNSPVVDITARSTKNLDPLLDPVDLETYLSTATIGEMKALLPDQPKDFWTAKGSGETLDVPRAMEGSNAFWNRAVLTDEALDSRKREIKKVLLNQTSEQQQAIARIAGIKTTTEAPAEVYKNMPVWMQNFTQYGAIALPSAEILGSPRSGANPAFAEAQREKAKQEQELRLGINKALKSAGANNVNVVDFMVNDQGIDRDYAERMVTSVIKGHVRTLLQKEYTPNEIFKVMLQQGYKAEDIDRYLPATSILQSAFNKFMDNAKMTRDMTENIVALVTIGSTSFDDSAEIISARAATSNETVLGVWNNIMAPFSRTMAIRGKHEIEAINTENMMALSRAGITAQRAPDGTIMVPDSNGTLIPLDVNWYDIMASRGFEIGGSVGGFFAGYAKTPGNPLTLWGQAAKVAGGTVAGALGAGSGRGADIMRARLLNKQALEGKFILDEMVAAGAADAVLNTALVGIFKTGQASLFIVKRAYDLAFQGNIKGANQALMEIMHMTEDEADVIVRQWEKLNPAVKLGGSQAAKRLRIIPRTAADAFVLAGPASKESSLMSTNLAREISTRAKDLQSQVQTATNERMGAILRDELPIYLKRVDDIYAGTKAVAVEQMKGKNYIFDYSTIVLEPLLDRTVKGIQNPRLREKASALFSSIQRAGGKQIVTSEGTTIVAPIRTFEDLLDVKRLLLEFKNTTAVVKANKRDIASVDQAILNVDKEITKTARANLGKASGNQWLAAWKAANQGLENSISIKANVLFRAIMQKGVGDKQVLKTLLKTANSLDGTYRELMQALPKRMRAPTEGAVISELVKKWSIGEVSGRQAIDFVALDKQLEHIPLTTPHHREVKRAIAEMARVYKNDPHLLAASGTVKMAGFQSYLTDNPAVRIKYWAVSEMMNYVRRLIPSEKGRETAMIMAIARLLKDPADSTRLNTVLDFLPADPAVRNEMRRAALEIAEWNEKSNFPKVEVYGQAPVGHTMRPQAGSMGLGRYFYLDKTQARTAARAGGRAKLNAETFHPDRIADEEVIKDVLGLPVNAEITEKFIKDHPDLRELLDNRSYFGIIVGKKIVVW